MFSLFFCVEGPAAFWPDFDMCGVCFFVSFLGVLRPGESALHSIGTALIVYCISIQTN